MRSTYGIYGNVNKETTRSSSPEQQPHHQPAVCIVLQYLELLNINTTNILEYYHILLMLAH